MTTPFTAPPYLAPDGPGWLKNARVGDIIRDGRGVRWEVRAVEQGGRVLHWQSWGGLSARTEAAPEHPDYPTDAEVLAVSRAAKREAQRRLRGI